MAEDCTYLERLIPETENVGDSLETINNNFKNLSDGLCNAFTETAIIEDEISDTVANMGAPPIGSIVFWSGSMDDIPENWAICDGSRGTPNLLGMFIIGAGTTYEFNETGGENGVILTQDQIPSHNHDNTTIADLTVDHNHSILIGSGTESQHTHNIEGNTAAVAATPRAELSRLESPITKSTILGGGAHTHTITENSAGAHSHNLSLSTVGTNSAHENRPPYYALAFIMRVL